MDSVVAVVRSAVAGPTALPSLTNCDGVSTFFCPTGTCYTGYDGYIGCCSVASCAARTTCIPYTSAVSHTCDIDLGGCITCDAAMPACVTITNVVNSQYIMYCDRKAVLETVSYSNLVTSGSMAFPPDQTSVVMSTSKAMISSTSSPISTTTSSVFIPTPTGSDDSPGNGIGIVSAAIISSVTGIIIFTIGVVYLVQHCRGRERAMRVSVTASRHHRHRGHRHASGPSELPDNSHPTTIPLPLRHGRAPHITSTSATHLSDYISPLGHARLARIAEARDALAQELDAMPSTSQASSASPSANQHIPREASVTEPWAYSPTSNRSANPSVRWSSNYNATPGGSSRAHHRRTGTVHIPRGSTIRHVLGSELDDASIVSPNPSTSQFDTPFVGGVSPLVGRDHDRASVGENSPSSNVGAGSSARPLSGSSMSSRTSNIQHFPRRISNKRASIRRNKDEEELPKDLGLTATDASSAHVIPEAAIKKGLPTVEDETTHEETTTTHVKDTHAEDVNAGDVNTGDVNAGDVNAGDVNAEDVHAKETKEEASPAQADISNVDAAHNKTA